MAEEISIWYLVSNASLVVQLVMAILLLASVVSWFLIIQRSLYFLVIGRALRVFERKFWSGVELSELYQEGEGRKTVGLETVFRAGFKEYVRLSQKEASGESLLSGSHRAMRVVLSREEEGVERYLPTLATIGSTTPYIGLLGTVWGIMTSFQGLANVPQASLQVVAPGISEALIATAMGLFAAIPAVIGYNRFSAQADTVINKYETFAEEFSSILHRQVHSR